ncbi:uncharacterized protein BT62DRAFT_422360 [Guyanagaster necrorhizus]|uniref:Secreted protein n=1 Tax=Guyanagaster necrorhizus TaxID=856835 RepID=A0A9P8AYY9_9AGAR|nr:uncharacterized protein BT62DRAFT_422360 [Guyanagaster necrorhizus MCA 3950]KAG7451417.1 hypothetical protein BT62DRAFT_422360 [Guyanagaster necrorhizus MCA 3950]
MCALTCFQWLALGSAALLPSSFGLRELHDTFFFFLIEAIAEAVRRHSRFQHAALGSLGFKPSRYVSVHLEDSEC